MKRGLPTGGGGGGAPFCTIDKIELYQSESLNHKLLYRVYYKS